MVLNDIQKQFLKRALYDLLQADEKDAAESEVTFQARHFSLCQFDEEEYFPFELVPSGAVVETNISGLTDDLDYSHRDSICEVFRTDPNGLEAYLSAQNLQPESVCRVASGGRAGREITYSSAEDAIAAIIGAIESNRPLVSVKPVKMAKPSVEPEPGFAEKRRRIEQSLEFWRQSKLPEHRHGTLFADKKDPFGNGLCNDHKREILSYLNAPSLQSWEAIRSICIVDFTTVWQALIAQDPATPIQGDDFTAENLPRPESLIQALSNAVSRHNRNCDMKICEIERKLAEFDQTYPTPSKRTSGNAGG